MDLCGSGQCCFKPIMSAAISGKGKKVKAHLVPPAASKRKFLPTEVFGYTLFVNVILNSSVIQMYCIILF